MASNADDILGCLVTPVLLIAGAVWLYNTYEIKKRVPEPPVPIITPLPKPTVTRPTGDLIVSFSKSGTKWLLEADSVSGPRNARQGWVTVDASNDKTATAGTTRTLYLVDCETTATRILSNAVYGTGVSPTSAESHDPKEAKVDYYPPDTMGGAVVRRMCKADFDQD